MPKYYDIKGVATTLQSYYGDHVIASYIKRIIAGEIMVGGLPMIH